MIDMMKFFFARTMNRFDLLVIVVSTITLLVGSFWWALGIVIVGAALASFGEARYYWNNALADK